MSESLKRTLLCGLVAAVLGFGPAGAGWAQTAVCEDTSRTVFTGGPGSEGCLEIEDQATCEAAWTEGNNALRYSRRSVTSQETICKSCISMSTGRTALVTSL